MSDYQIMGIDYTSLPTALLPLLKQHARIDFFDDDSYLVNVTLPGAISLFERVTGQRVFGTTVDWFPVIDSESSSYQCPPLQPYSSFKVESPTGTDVSAQYRLRYTTVFEPWWLDKIDGTPFPADADITLTAGAGGTATLPPNILLMVLRIAAMLYEYRESVDVSGLSGVPYWMNDLLVGGGWIPRA